MLLYVHTYQVLNINLYVYPKIADAKNEGLVYRVSTYERMGGRVIRDIRR